MGIETRVATGGRGLRQTDPGNVVVVSMLQPCAQSSHHLVLAQYALQMQQQYNPARLVENRDTMNISERRESVCIIGSLN